MHALNSRFYTACSTLVCALLLSGTAAAVDRIELRDGSIVMGTFQDADGGKVKIETAYAGTLEIDQSAIVAMTVESDLVLQMEDGSV
ncbi:MAG: hypothetical protein ACI8RN_000694, partial [Glaciecola sp.]